jgi:hypothetical protein
MINKKKEAANTSKNSRNAAAAEIDDSLEFEAIDEEYNQKKKSFVVENTK